jgi:hypothetical protein
MQMQALAEKYETKRKELFRPLMLARKVLTNKCEKDVYDDWHTEMGEMIGKIYDDDIDIVYRVLALLFFKYSKEIKKSHDLMIDDFITQTELDDMTFYTHYYDDDMQQYAHASRIVELMETRTDLLLEIAKDRQISGAARVNALKELTSFAENYFSPDGTPININMQQGLVGINAGTGQGTGFDWSKLGGQDSDTFKDRLKGNGTEIIDASD